MTYGILKDRKRDEARVITTPADVKAIVERGHFVIAERGSGEKAGFDDESYALAGARIADSPNEIFEECDVVGKVKEFLPSEFGLIREGQILLGCIHPAANPKEVDALLEKKCIAFSAEDSHRYGSVNSEAAGKVGALFALESIFTLNCGGGKICGLVGAPKMNILVLGGGAAGVGALDVLSALGANCTVMDINYGRLKELDLRYGGRVCTAFSSKERIAEILPYMDIVINAVKWQKERRDFLIDRKMLGLMRKGSVIVDISNDAPGAVETSRETHFDSPRYIEEGVVHFAVSNLPSAAANSVSIAYSAQMLPMILSLLSDGVKETCIRNGYYRRSLTAYEGYLTHEETSAVQKRPWIKPEDALGIRDEKLDYAPPASTSRSRNHYKM